MYIPTEHTWIDTRLISSAKEGWHSTFWAVLASYREALSRPTNDYKLPFTERQYTMINLANHFLIEACKKDLVICMVYYRNKCWVICNPIAVKDFTVYGAYAKSTGNLIGYVTQSTISYHFVGQLELGWNSICIGSELAMKPPPKTLEELYHRGEEVHKALSTINMDSLGTTSRPSDVFSNLIVTNDIPALLAGNYITSIL